MGGGESDGSANHSDSYGPKYNHGPKPAYFFRLIDLWCITYSVLLIKYISWKYIFTIFQAYLIHNF